MWYTITLTEAGHAMRVDRLTEDTVHQLVAGVLARANQDHTDQDDLVIQVEASYDRPDPALCDPLAFVPWLS